jgi:hypothetical protein
LVAALTPSKAMGKQPRRIGRKRTSHPESPDSWEFLKLMFEGRWHLIA